MRPHKGRSDKSLTVAKSSASNGAAEAPKKETIQKEISRPLLLFSDLNSYKITKNIN